MSKPFPVDLKLLVNGIGPYVIQKAVFTLAEGNEYATLISFGGVETPKIKLEKVVPDPDGNIKGPVVYRWKYKWFPIIGPLALVELITDGPDYPDKAARILTPVDFGISFTTWVSLNWTEFHILPIEKLELQSSDTEDELFEKKGPFTFDVFQSMELMAASEERATVTWYSWSFKNLGQFVQITEWNGKKIGEDPPIHDSGPEDIRLLPDGYWLIEFKEEAHVGFPLFYSNVFALFPGIQNPLIKAAMRRSMSGGEMGGRFDFVTWIPEVKEVWKSKDWPSYA